jgi:nucleotide-binding universal stress UspA family protein
MSKIEKQDESKTSTKSNTVVVGVDESAAVPLIVEFVVNHNWPADTNFRIIHAVAPIMLDHPMASYPLFLESVEKDVREYAEKLLERVKSDIQKKIPAHQITTEVIAGQPAEVIIDEAKTTNANLIVVGSHGRSGFTRFLLGSVSGAIASHAPCNIMIVRVPRREESLQHREPAVKALSTAST